MLRATLLLLFVHTLFWTISAKPCPKSIHTKDDIPKLTLPWGSYKGEFYGESQETVLYKNVRFGKDPRGKLRFAKPEYPDAIKDSNQIQDNTDNIHCVEAELPKKTKFFPPPPPSDTKPRQQEDCLFLDVYVPAWALDPDLDEKLPVIVWIFGGAYFFGGKNQKFDLPTGPFDGYDGQGIRDITDNGVIWVSGNYRLGAYGFLGGSYMENKETAQTNAGLHDQRLLLDWVQNHIGKVGGDKDNVSLWGLSAGGGSILHHLTAYANEKKDSLFKRVAVWSTAFQWQYDRTGTLQDTFQSFAEKADCKNDDPLECLRNADDDTLDKANQQVVLDSIVQGLFPFGPAVDGDLVPDLPAVLLNKGQHVQVDSIIMSHNLNESGMFLADWVRTKEDFTAFVNLAFPGDDLKGVREDIEVQYPSKNYLTQRLRLEAVTRDSTFVCNNYQIYKAYKDKSRVYAASYEIPPSFHGFDLFPIIWNQRADISDIIKIIGQGFDLEPIANLLEGIWVYFAQSYQRYFGAHAISGDPNYLNHARTLTWKVATDNGNDVTDTLKMNLLYSNRAHPFFGSGLDTQVSGGDCAFWTDVANKISQIKGNGANKKTNPASFIKQANGHLRVVAEIEL